MQKKKKKKKILIEIFTNKNGWTVVELISKMGPKITIRMPDGQIIKRKPIRVHWEVIKRVDGVKILSSLKPKKNKKNRKRKPSGFKKDKSYEPDSSRKENNNGTQKQFSGRGKKQRKSST